MAALTNDVIIVGGGHNGLVCAWYLARAGLKVTVLERRGVVGGAAVTEEFHPGFRNSVASYTVSLLNPKVIADMALADHGLRIVERKVANFLPLNDRDYFIVGEGRTAQEVARFSEKDAARLPEYNARLEVIADAGFIDVIAAGCDAGVGPSTPETCSRMPACADASQAERWGRGSSSAPVRWCGSIPPARCWCTVSPAHRENIHRKNAP